MELTATGTDGGNEPRKCSDLPSVTQLGPRVELGLEPRQPGFGVPALSHCSGRQGDGIRTQNRAAHQRSAWLAVCAAAASLCLCPCASPPPSLPGCSPPLSLPAFVFPSPCLSLSSHLPFPSSACLSLCVLVCHSVLSVPSCPFPTSPAARPPLLRASALPVFPAPLTTSMSFVFMASLGSLSLSPSVYEPVC